MKRIPTYIILLVLTTMLTAACSDNESGDTLYARFTEEPQTVPGFGAVITLKVESNTEWHLEKQASDTWYHVTPRSGRGDTELKVVIDPSADSKDERTGQLTIYGGTEPATVNIAQARLTVPDAAGDIEGNSEAGAGETIMLTVPAVNNATQYNWRRNGVLINTTDEPSLDINLDGSYTVSGVNMLGEGAQSKAKEIKFGRDYTFDKVMTASYIGGDFSYYVLELRREVSPGVEICTWMKLGEDAPGNLNDINLPARTYVALEPYQNNYTSKGIVYPGTETSVLPDTWTKEPPQAGRVYIRKDGEVLTGSEMFFKNTADNKITVNRTGKHYTIKGTLDCVQPVIKDSDFGPYVESLNDCGKVELNFDGDIGFINEAHDKYDTYYYNLGDNFGRDINIKSLSARMIYNYTGVSGKWFFQIFEGVSYAEPGWAISGTFYSNAPEDPVGTYMISNDAAVEKPGTMPRGYFLNNTYGGLYAAHYSDVSTRDKLVLGQPNTKSYLKIVKTGDGTYSMTITVYDMKGHKLATTFSGTPNLIKGTAVSGSTEH